LQVRPQVPEPPQAANAQPDAEDEPTRYAVALTDPVGGHQISMGVNKPGVFLLVNSLFG
jgi:hypothetical protein